MKHRTVLTTLIFTGFLAACSSVPMLDSSASAGAAAPVSSAPLAPYETTLLVSLEDGSVIMQKIASTADICFKANSHSATTCLTQGAPVISPETDAVIGYEMIEEQIDLVAKSN